MTTQLPSEISETEYLAELDKESLSDGRLRYEELAVRIPRLRLLKSTSKFVKEGRAQPGNFWSDLHEGTVGKVTIIPGAPPSLQWDEPIVCVPLFFFYEWIFFKEKPNELEVDYRTLEKNDPRVQALGDQEFRKRFTHVLLMIDRAPVVFSTSGYDNDRSRSFYNTCCKPKLIRGQWVKVPFQAQVFRLTSNWNVKNDHPSPLFSYACVASKEDYAAAKSLMIDCQENLTRSRPAFDDVENEVSTTAPKREPSIHLEGEAVGNGEADDLPF